MCEFAIPGAITILWTLSLECCVLSLPSVVASDIIAHSNTWNVVWAYPCQVGVGIVAWLGRVLSPGHYSLDIRSTYTNCIH